MVGKPEVILCDIDGTVANCEHRKHFIDKTIQVGDIVYVKGQQHAKRNPLRVLQAILPEA